jgi:hypothetical protein
MRRTAMVTPAAAMLIGLSMSVNAVAAPFFFSTGTPDGAIAIASRPGSGAGSEIESADDFVLTSPTTVTSATFSGLMPASATTSEVVVEIYRVFPDDSNTGRTPDVPTRVNSPSDVALMARDSSASQLNFMTTVLADSFTVNNSVQPGGIHPSPNQTTGGDGPVTNAEVSFAVTFVTPIDLAAGHYFFVPQVLLDTTGTANGDFLWLSAPKPIVPPGTPFSPGNTDLQSWTRDHSLDPDWLRVGTDIVGAGTFNAAFSVTGTTDVIPEPTTLSVFGVGVAGLLLRRRHAARRAGT